MKGSVVISMLVVLAMAQFMVKPGQATAVSCDQVNSCLAACIPYLTGLGNAPTVSCCAGVKRLTEITPTTEDRRAACDCVKKAAASFPNIKDDAASSLPIKCGVEMHIPISKNTNCAK
ncbi:LTP_2 domain-containing protein [Cephalotus follicularis]|uniref:Non-specific lipid-transfer protein n=1 Tax=Cephalotus follicularis TaxID=3775 RepID=A0A1Q3CQL5_CEPFO|nr:LTP_2 domain-containing protein [Cephalotus follicularis]